MRIWLAVIALVVLFVILLITVRAFAIGLYANPITLQLLRWLPSRWAWAGRLLFVNAWRIGQSRATSARQSGSLWPPFCVVLAIAVAFGLVDLLGRRRLDTSIKVGWSAMCSSAEAARPRRAGRYNVLLLGGDAGADRERPQSGRR